MSSLLEFGFYIKMAKSKFAREVVGLLEQAYEEGYFSKVIYKEMKIIAYSINNVLELEFEMDKKIRLLNIESKEATLLKTIPGIGEINASILSIASYDHYDDS